MFRTCLSLFTDLDNIDDLPLGNKRGDGNSNPLDDHTTESSTNINGNTEFPQF